MTRNHILRSLPIASFSVAALFLATAMAQQPVTPPAFYRVDFLKAKPGKLTDYEAFLKKNLPGISQASIKAGKLSAWGFTSVVSPTGTAEEHDLIGFYSYDKWEQMEPLDEAPDYVKAAMKAVGFASPADYAAKRDPLRDVVRSEVWKREAGTTATADMIPKAGDYVLATYLKAAPGKESDYLEVWKKYSLPIQEDRVKAGKLKSYSMWTVVGSAGTDSKYNVVALSRFATFKELAPVDDTEELDKASEQVHAGKDWRQMRRDMVGLRTVYRSEMLKIQDVVR